LKRQNRNEAEKNGMKGNKKSRNYGNAARQGLFPLGNDRGVLQIVAAMQLAFHDTFGLIL